MSAADQVQTDITVAAKTVADQERLLERATDAHKAMKFSADSFKQAWSEWSIQADAALADARRTRMALDVEWAKVLAACGDVRKFFLSVDHAAEVARLREFVDLCERLKVLEESGFLNRVADVVLKLDGGGK